jgi:hypothetical protein
VKLKIIGGLAAATVSAAMLTACTTSTPALSECGATTNGGFGASGQGITSITLPGGRVTTGAGETAWYWPCNPRNFATGSNGDRPRQQAIVRTNGDGKGTPGMPVLVDSTVYFSANENSTAIKKFLPFCFKYGCATNNPQTDASVSDSAHSSSKGWENMLLENMGPAVDRAAQVAALGYGPDLWLEQGDWNALGDKIASAMNAQLDKETETTTPFFCGANSTPGRCDGMTVVVSSVTPEDPAVVATYNREVQAEQSKAANAARLAQAQLLYGSEANYWLGIQDTEANCPRCTFIVGDPGNVPVAAVPGARK